MVLLYQFWYGNTVFIDKVQYMKRITGLLCVFVIGMIVIGHFLMVDDLFEEQFVDKFNKPINIISNPKNVRKNVLEIQRLAKKHNVSFIKDVYIPKNTNNDKRKIIIFTFLHEVKWFKKEFKNIEIEESHNDLNKFAKSKSLNLLTTKNVKMKAFNEINHNWVNGDYHLKGANGDVEKFIVALNKITGLEVKKDNEFMVTGDFTQAQGSLYMMLMAIVIIALFFCCIIYNSSLSREFAISSLLGHNKLQFCLRKVFSLVLPPSLISFVAINAILFLLTKSKTFFGYLNAVAQLYLTELIVVIAVMAIEFALLFLKVRGVNLIDILKGYRRTHEKIGVAFKVLTFTVVMYMLVVTLFSLNQYLDLKPNIEKWGSVKNYVNIGCTWTNTEQKDNEKMEKTVIPILSKLWDKLDARGALMYYAPLDEFEGMPVDEEYNKKQMFKGKYAYINKNFLDYAKIIDKDGKQVEISKTKRNEWVALVPENVKISKFDKFELKDTHKFYAGEKKSKIKERYLTIKSGQNIFALDSQKRLDMPHDVDYALIVAGESCKIPSLVNGKFHPYVKNPDKAYEELRKVIKETKAEPYITDLRSIYSEVVRHIDRFKIMAVVNLTGLLLALLILGTLLKIDQESYFHDQGQRINVSRLFGYSFFTIHKKKISGNIFGYLISVILLFVTIFSTSIFGGDIFYIPRTGWSISYLFVSLLLAIATVFICGVVEIFQIRKGEKELVIQLKEGC